MVGKMDQHTVCVKLSERALIDTGSGVDRTRNYKVAELMIKNETDGAII